MKQNELAGEDGIGIGTAPGAYRLPDGSRPDEQKRPLTLPPNTSLDKFNNFMQRIAEIVGVENATVISSDNELKHESYLDPSKAYDVLTLPMSNQTCCTYEDTRCIMSHRRSTLSALLLSLLATFQMSKPS